MSILIAYFVGIVVGIIAKTLFVKSSEVGSIDIFQGDPGENPNMFLTITTSLESFVKKKYVVLKLERKDPPNAQICVHDTQPRE